MQGQACVVQRYLQEQLGSQAANRSQIDSAQVAIKLDGIADSWLFILGLDSRTFVRRCPGLHFPGIRTGCDQT